MCIRDRECKDKMCADLKSRCGDPRVAQICPETCGKCPNTGGGGGPIPGPGGPPTSPPPPTGGGAGCTDKLRVCSVLGDSCDAFFSGGQFANQAVKDVCAKTCKTSPPC
eukprot:TRINITY_DN620_c0_g1_i18.p2 TRINITY_DN620_c0_g1~~TRINITY_DN620_c0_g1_i18.p2  ORF type:complete len:109 (+),score=21.62 TRINITY_DN620_c0_g1_i18:185-511(+)